MLKLGLFRQNFKNVCKLMKTVKKNLKETSKLEVQEDMKIVRIISAVLVASLFVAYLVEIFNALRSLRSTLRYFVLDLLYYIIFFATSLASDVTNTVLQIVFFNLSVHICSLFKQFERDLKELNVIADENSVKKTVKNLVASHHMNLEQLSNLIDSFYFVISINLVLYIVNIGNALLFLEIQDWYGLLLVMPFMIFDAWIYCHSCQIIKTAVNFN